MASPGPRGNESEASQPGQLSNATFQLSLCLILTMALQGIINYILEMGKLSLWDLEEQVFGGQVFYTWGGTPGRQ